MRLRNQSALEIGSERWMKVGAVVGLQRLRRMQSKEDGTTAYRPESQQRPGWTKESGRGIWDIVRPVPVWKEEEKEEIRRKRRNKKRRRRSSGGSLWKKASDHRQEKSISTLVQHKCGYIDRWHSDPGSCAYQRSYLNGIIASWFAYWQFSCGSDLMQSRPRNQTPACIPDSCRICLSPL